ncbi:MAG: citrate synthase [Candidatus Micrarchaeota archaeon]|nr:citrate synthase [Candidatus Micrarchaeota archaeon]MDE1846832.1 citrate synthase [Candidatus Micrarchaeota archaeon]
MAEADESILNKGLEGIVVATSEICKIDGANGKLYYRGYSIGDLANGSYEETSYLLIYGRLPNRKELSEFSATLVRERELPKHIVDILMALPNDTNSMEALRTCVSALGHGARDPREVSLEEQTRMGIALVAKFPTIVAYNYRLRNGQQIVAPNPRLGHAANFLYMLFGKEPDQLDARAMDMDFILHAEHSFNASTFATRVTVSTLSDIYSAFTTGIGTLKGPLHGGAALEVSLMLEKIGSPDKVDGYVREVLSGHGRVMGYGHRVYKTYDPRARVLNNMALEISQKRGDMRYYEIAQKLEGIMAGEKNLYPNVDFYSGIVYHHLGMPADINTPIFAIARASGWVAHCVEQYKNNRLIRPLDQYIGPLDLKYTKIDDR